MASPERRNFPRTKMARIACIHIEPDNGGIVLNVSSEGLCFHSTAPVERNGKFRFALMEHNRRLDVAGELIWTESTRKIGGVRFTTLSTEAREQIQSWSLSTADDAMAASTSRPNFAKALSLLNTLDFRKPADTATLRAANRARVRIKFSSFSRGLATGLLLSLVIVSGLLFVNAHRRQFGESLINLGERLASHPLPKVAASAVPQADPQAFPLPESKSSSVMPSAEESHAKAATSSSNRAAALADTRAAAATEPRHDDPNPVRVAPISPAREPVKQASSQSAPDPPKISPVTSASLQIAAPVSILSEIALKTPQLAPVNSVIVPNFAGDSVFLPSMYFDLGKYKDEMRAQDISERISRLGFHSSVVHKAFLWRTSYQVLVGPYTNEEQATRIGRDLVSQGYKPRPFERGTRAFVFGSGVTLNGARLPVGDFEISWESYVNAAKVKFSQRDEVLANAEGRWVKQRQRFRHNEFVYVRSPNGIRTLIEIHFSGMDRALVFGKA